MTTYSSVEFVSRWEAASRKGSADTIVISINNTFDSIQKLESGWKDVLVLQFDGVDSLMNTSLKRLTLDQAKEIAAFLRKHEDTATKVLVHCTMGEKRSAAVAKAVAETYGLPFPADYQEHQRWVYKVLSKVLLAPAIA
jgi:predicted protein tyrosine phosphatase